jgi:hypothetical protein
MPKQILKSAEQPPVQATEATKSIKNYSLQGITIILKSGNNFENVWLKPKESIRVSESQITQQIKNLHRRRLINIGN